MSDLIKREDAIKVISNRICDNKWVCECAINSLPSADAVQEWVPCDGKLPKTVGDHVLVTIKWADDDLEVCEMCPTSASRYNIVAYQHMPTPYKGGDDE